MSIEKVKKNDRVSTEKEKETYVKCERKISWYYQSIVRKSVNKKWKVLLVEKEYGMS